MKKLQFIGIGGVGISALAKMLLNKGYQISGINDSESKKTLQELRDKGVQIELGTDPKLLDESADMYIYSVAWLERAPELMKKALDSKKAKNYFEALGDFAKDMKVLAVSGTHGKTTTTAMLHEILKAHDFTHETIVGSILASEGSNYVPADKNTDYLLVEACEYKRHFLNFYPELLVITNIEAEHLDYYKDLEDVQSAFLEVAQQTKGKKIVANLKDENSAQIFNKFKAHERQDFEMVDYSAFVHGLPELSVPGEHNKMNAAAALAAAATLLKEKFNLDLAKSALKNFKGTWRRFQYLSDTQNGAKIYSDYAHHPTEIKATIQAAREKAESGRVIVVFEPHTYSRLKALMDDFAGALSLADEILLVPVYAAREKEIEGINSKVLSDKINTFTKEDKAKFFDDYKIAFENTMQDSRNGDMILAMGAGDIHESLTKYLYAKNTKKN